MAGCYRGLFLEQKETKETKNANVAIDKLSDPFLEVSPG